MLSRAIIKKKKSRRKLEKLSKTRQALAECSQRLILNKLF